MLKLFPSNFIAVQPLNFIIHGMEIKAFPLYNQLTNCRERKRLGHMINPWGPVSLTISYDAIFSHNLVLSVGLHVVNNVLSSLFNLLRLCSDSFQLVLHNTCCLFIAKRVMVNCICLIILVRTESNDVSVLLKVPWFEAVGTIFLFHAW